jgi:site-specific DNA-cytosine methylase
MKVLVACEESQEVCKAFRARGHEAYSCDLQECSGRHPEWHLQMDVFQAIALEDWDIMIAFPPCTYLCTAGQACKTRDNVWDEREAETAKAIEFVKRLYYSDIQKVAIENPVGVLSSRWRKPNQIIEPYYFGDQEKKTTCLWLKGLTRLNATTPDAPKPLPTHVYPSGRKEYFGQRVGNKYRFSKDRGKMKSKTFPGIAKAMADQWG